MEQSIGNTIAETEAFIRTASALWSGQEIESLKYYLALNPLIGDEIPGTGGLRKVRWGRAGMGKRGGARVIYYYYDASAPLFLLAAYTKASQEDLTPGEKAALTKAATLLKASIKSRKGKLAP